MDNYNDKLASSLLAYPKDLGGLNPNAINTNAFNELQKARLLQALQQSYLRQGKPLSPLEQYTNGSAQSMAQNGIN